MAVRLGKVGVKWAGEGHCGRSVRKVIRHVGIHITKTLPLVLQPGQGGWGQQQLLEPIQEGRVGGCVVLQFEQVRQCCQYRHPIRLVDGHRVAYVVGMGVVAQLAHAQNL
jgi:hypothetical protein